MLTICRRTEDESSGTVKIGMKFKSENLMKKIMFNDLFGLTRAVLTGKKTQTRRIAYDFRKHVTCQISFRNIKTSFGSITYLEEGQVPYELSKSRYKVGEEVAVAQSYMDILGDEYLPPSVEDEVITLVQANSKGISNKMFVRADLMPHSIKILDYHVEHLQDISDEDCIKEGVRTDGYAQKYYTVSGFKNHYSTPQEAFAHLIDKLAGKGTWDSNPYVYVYEFEKVR